LGIGGSFTKNLQTSEGHNRFVLVKGSSSVQPARLYVEISDSSFFMKVRGEPGLVYSVEISENMEVWRSFTEVTVPEEGALTLDLGQTEGVRYYRAVYRK